MSNDTAKTITTNIVPVQGTFEPLPPYECINLIGPAGTPFFAPVNPNLDGVNITNSTINSTTIGATTPSTGVFTNISTTNGSITSPPSGPNSIVNQAYVDSVAQGLSFKQPAAYKSTGNLTLSGLGVQAGGDWASSLTAGMRILVTDQAAPAENGIYVASSSAWTRSSDANTWDELIAAYLFVTSGATWGGSSWVNTNQPGGTLGVTAVTFIQFSNNATYTAGTGLTLAGFQFSITNTGVSASTYGSASVVPVIAVNAQGQITSATNTNIAIDAAAITSGTINTARISGDYSGITGVGTLTNLTVSNTISGSISGNAATATTATTATSATTATNLAGGTTGSVPYQSGAGATTFVGIGSTGQVLTVAGGVPTWATPTTGTVTSVSGTGTVSGISLSGTVTSSGSLTLGGSLDLSSPPTIGNTTPNTIAGTTVTASTSFASPVFKAANSAGGTLQNASGTPQMQWGSGGGNNLSLEVATNINPANAAVSISPTGTGTVAISPSGALTVNPTTASTMNNVAIGGTTPLAGTFTNLRVNNTISLNGSTGTAGYVLTSNGASAPTWEANTNGVTITDDTTTNATRYITFSELTTGTETTLDVSSTKLRFNPSSGTLTATAFVGDGSGLTGVGGGFAAGTRLIFAQTSAPTGWTKDTVNYNNHALRVVTGTASTGGTVDFTSAFTSQTPSGTVSTTVNSTTATNQNTTAGGSVSISSISATIGSTTLATSQIPAHSHSSTAGVTGGGWVSRSDGGFNNFGTFANITDTGGGGSHNHSFSFSSGSASFSGTAHSHTQDAHNHTASSSFSGNAINLAVKYLDVITATKD